MILAIALPCAFALASLLCFALAMERAMRRRYTITRKSSLGLYRRMIDAQTMDDARRFARIAKDQRR